MNGLLFITASLIACLALWPAVSIAQLYDTPETRARAEAQKREQVKANQKPEPTRPILEAKKAEAMEYVGKTFQYFPNPAADYRIRFYEKIPSSSHSQDPNLLFTPLTNTTFVVRGIVMPPPVFYAVGEDEYLLEIEFPDGKLGYVNVVGCCGLKHNLLIEQLDTRKEYVRIEGTSPAYEEIVAKEKARQEQIARQEAEEQAQEQAKQERIAKEEEKAKALAERQARLAEQQARLAKEKAEKERAQRIAERKRREAMPSPRIGMTWQTVVHETNWGRPYDVNRTTTRWGTREQWVYGDRRYLYFENGVLTAIQD